MTFLNMKSPNIVVLQIKKNIWDFGKKKKEKMLRTVKNLSKEYIRYHGRAILKNTKRKS